MSSDVEKESEAVVVCSQGLFALALLVFALKKLKLGEPLKDRIGDFCPTGFVLVLNNRNVRVESFEICLLALLSVDCCTEVVANGLPWTGAVGRANTAGSRDRRD